MNFIFKGKTFTINKGFAVFYIHRRFDLNKGCLELHDGIDDPELDNIHDDREDSHDAAIPPNRIIRG
jgi:hypothetical protein